MNNWPELGWSDEVTISWSEGPTSRNIKVLDRALELSQSVPYNVTLRWLFYGLWQEGWFSNIKPAMKKSAKQNAYEGFSKLMSRLRHSPDELQVRWQIDLSDDRRDPIHRSNWINGTSEWLEMARAQLTCNTEKMIGQDVYVMVAFEAEAMQSQFVYFTQPYGVSLWPFSGQASIPYKKRFAEHIEKMAEMFELPIVVLYFGDYDEAGKKIPESAFRHVRKWCDTEFEAYRVGLNLDQVQKYNIQEDPDKPGKFQWEAVPNEPAREIVVGALESLLHHDAILEIEKAEKEMTIMARKALEELKT